jgi:hypothetical protein
MKAPVPEDMDSQKLTPRAQMEVPVPGDMGWFLHFFSQQLSFVDVSLVTCKFLFLYNVFQWCANYYLH